MSGPKIDYKRYREHLKTMPEPIMQSQLPKRELNLKEIAKYMKENEINPKHLSDDEKERIIVLAEKKREQPDIKNVL